MQKITSSRELQAAISKLEADREGMVKSMKDQIGLITEALKPSNLIRRVMMDVISSPLVLMLGVQTVKSYGHRLIDKVVSWVKNK